jgi:hypothetical protein
MLGGKPMIGGEASGGKEGDGDQVNKEQTPVEQGASSSTAAGARSGGIDDLFDQLDLGDEDFDDFVIAEEDPVIVDSIRWLAIGRICYEKRFSHEAFFQQMRAAWNPAREISIRPVTTPWTRCEGK